MRGQRHAPATFYPRERPGIRCTGGWVGPRAGLDTCGKNCPPPGFDLRTVQPVASRYTDWATRPNLCQGLSKIKDLSLAAENMTSIRTSQLFTITVTLLVSGSYKFLTTASLTFCQLQFLVLSPLSQTRNTNTWRTSCFRNAVCWYGVFAAIENVLRNTADKACLSACLDRPQAIREEDGRHQQQ